MPEIRYRVAYWNPLLGKGKRNVIFNTFEEAFQFFQEQSDAFYVGNSSKKLGKFTLRFEVINPDGNNKTIYKFYGDTPPDPIEMELFLTLVGR